MAILQYVPVLLYPQDSFFREEHPVATKIGFQEIGFDLALGNYVGMDVTTWILTTTCNARFCLVEKNASPFIGWKHSYDVVLIQIVFQTPFVKRNEYGLFPFFFNLNLGARLR